MFAGPKAGLRPIYEKDRITRRIEVTALADIDLDLKKWLKVAFDRDA